MYSRDRLKLIQIRAFHKDYWSAVLVRMKIISGMNITETRLPQDGRINFHAAGRDIDLRVSTQPTNHGENVVMRILDSKQSLLPMIDLGFSEKSCNILKRALKRPEGIILVTGPTGSGKTTTLYSVLNYINTIDKNIMTLEDPIEYQMPLIRQTHINEAAGMTFSEGIKSMLRQDPDVIFVGEVRDSDTASMAIRAAMTGHQVFSTLHTNDSLGAIPRLIDIGIDSFLLASSLICVIAQRLARKLCLHCREEYTASEDECKILGVPTDNPPKLYRHKGCDKCMNTGYKGRIVIGEILVIDRELQELISTGATKSKMLEYARSTEFKTMQLDGIDKVLQGITDIDAIVETIDMTSRMKDITNH
ncbi:MAG: GspE/PulE family protein [Pseudomonadota bacterium]